MQKQQHRKTNISTCTLRLQQSRVTFNCSLCLFQGWDTEENTLTVAYLGIQLWPWQLFHKQVTVRCFHNQCIPAEKRSGWSAVTFCEGKFIALFSVVFYLQASCKIKHLTADDRQKVTKVCCFPQALPTFKEPHPHPTFHSQVEKHILQSYYGQVSLSPSSSITVFFKFFYMISSAQTYELTENILSYEGVTWIIGALSNTGSHIMV
jgi:hypothetical protein